MHMDEKQRCMSVKYIEYILKILTLKPISETFYNKISSNIVGKEPCWPSQVYFAVWNSILLAMKKVLQSGIIVLDNI